MLTLLIVLAAVISALHLRTLIMSTEDRHFLNKQEVNGAAWGISKLWNSAMEQYGLPIAHYCVSVGYAIYLRLTFINVMIFILKYVPTGCYMYKFIRDMYVTSRERIKQKQNEIEDIQLQIQIVNTKLCVRDAEFAERAEQLRRGAERLRRVRARVREVIAADDTVRHAIDNTAVWDANKDLHMHCAPQEEDREFIVELLKELKYDHMANSERQPEKMECGERAPTDPTTPENSVYSSLSDADVRQDCRVKILKVTNVYKVAYLKHYIKQKRLRRATKQAMLKKKMESIKKLLEDWQKTLNMVINSKLTILNLDPHPIDVASQEAMGDYSKPRESSDSDSDFRNSCTDVRYDEYSLSWAENPYKPYAYNYEDVADANRDYYDTQQDFGDVKPMFACERGKMPNMMSIIEETNSQIAIEEIKSECGDDYECRDLVVL
ncbi:unnamed protein product [Spodoptera littoralis]|uniref:Uncharacterized protein n=1 Tax=Spodoptera littoralis TaxID=7109 RepID=A0A9P0I4F4_SPOLI|nr:unnamed protein product [Spodoptera littoralis]CAH1639810.1 unnamed protein product [Spodoptera littoralis]